MKTHELKIWPQYWEAVRANQKTFEVRKHDRDFKVGEGIWLCEYDPEQEAYTGRAWIKKITYILQGGQFGIEEGYCVLGLSYEEFTEHRFPA